MPTRKPLGRRWPLLAACLLSILVGCTITCWASTRTATRDSARVLLSANQLERLIVDLETGQLGYVATGDRRSLRPWTTARAAYPLEAARLQRLAEESSTAQGVRARAIVLSTDSYLRDHAVPLVSTAEKDLKTARSLIARGEGRRRIDAIRDQFDRFAEIQHRIATTHERDAAPATRRMLALAAGTSGSVLALMLAIGLVTRTGTLRRKHHQPPFDENAPAPHGTPGRTTGAPAVGVATHNAGARDPEGGQAGDTESRRGAGTARERETLHRTPPEGTEDTRTAPSTDRDATSGHADGVAGGEEGALRRVATLVARGGAVDGILGVVAYEMGRVLDADHAVVGRYDGGALNALAHWNAWQVPGLVPPGGPRPVEGGTVEALVLSARRAVWVSGADPGTGEIGSWARARGVRRVVGCPVLVGGRVWGVVMLMFRAPGAPVAGVVRTMTGFAELAGIAVANAAASAELAASRVRLVDASDAARRKIERDLHDRTQQRLVSVGLELRAAEAGVPPGQDALRSRLSTASHDLADIAENLRKIARDLHPAILTKGGLAPSLRNLARRSPVPVLLDVRVSGRVPERVAVTVHHAVSEALANAVRHAHASEVRVDLHADEAAVRLYVRDDGAGGADPARGLGLTRLRDRIEALGGTMRIDSPVRGGTSLRIRIPLDDA